MSFNDKGLRLAESDALEYSSIWQEVHDYLALSPEKQAERLSRDPLGEVLGGLRTSRGFLSPLSIEAQAGLDRIVSRRLKHLGPSAVIHNPKTICRRLRDAYADSIISGEQITSEMADGLFDAALRKAEDTYCHITYHIPCSTVIEQSYTSFSIGPVRFTSRETFMTQHSAQIESSLAAFNGGRPDDPFASEFRSFFGSYLWIASVTVPKSDPEVSKHRARWGIQKALDVLKLFVGSYRGAHIKQAYDARMPPGYVEMISDGDNRFSFSWGRTMHDAITNERWYEQLLSSRAWTELTLVFSNVWDRWGETMELEERLLDAVSWHSDAISDSDVGARIVKFWTAIERLLSTRAGENVTSRVAVVLTSGREDFDSNLRRAQRLYSRRSKVVHGDAARIAGPWHEQTAIESEQASRMTILTYLQELTNIGSLPEKTPRGKLTNWLKHVDVKATEWRASKASAYSNRAVHFQS